LAAEEQLELVAQCTTPAEALEIMKDSVVHVILVDLGIAVDFLPCAREARYHMKSLVIARSADAPGSAIVLSPAHPGSFWSPIPPPV
jgi:DNA-binding NarL/FixJ family response regulator